MSDNNTQLTSAVGYNTSNMLFSTPQSGSIPNTPITYKRVNIQTTNPDGTVGDLILSTTQLFSFGICENLNQETKKLNGYVMPICLWNRDKDKVTKEEKAWSDTFSSIIDRCKKHVIDNKKVIEKYDLEMSDLKKLNPLYWKKTEGKIVEGTGPTLYAKLIVSKKQNKIVTMFSDFTGNPVDPLTLCGKYVYVKAAVKIESIFIGNKISMQIKLYECEVKLVDNSMKRLLTKVNTNVVESSNFLPLSNLTDFNDSDNEDDIINDDIVPKKEEVKEEVKEVIVKKKVKIVKK